MGFIGVPGNDSTSYKSILLRICFATTYFVYDVYCLIWGYYCIVWFFRLVDNLHFWND